MRIYVDKRYKCGCSGSMKCGIAIQLWDRVNGAYANFGNTYISGSRYQDALRDYDKHYDTQELIGTTSTVLQ